MRNAIAKVRQWWSNGRSGPAPAVPFEVTCVCGRATTGWRQAKSQAFACPECKQSLFVFPVSPLPPVAPLEGEPPPPVPAALAPGTRPLWFWPAVAGGGTLAVVTLVFAFVLWHLLSLPPGADRTSQATAADAEAQWAQGRKALAIGEFRQAADKLNAAAVLLRAKPDLLPAAEGRKLLNQQREADLLFRWDRDGRKATEKLFENLNNDPDLLREYRDRVLIFDAEVRRDPRGVYHVEYRRLQVRELVRLDLQDFKLLQRLPLQEPQRLIFAGRLADATRAGGAGPWVVRLEPDSGVLLTDIEAASICTGSQPVDAALQEVIQWQTKWVENPP